MHELMAVCAVWAVQDCLHRRMTMAIHIEFFEKPDRVIRQLGLSQPLTTQVLLPVYHGKPLTCVLEKHLIDGLIYSFEIMVPFFKMDYQRICRKPFGYCVGRHVRFDQDGTAFQAMQLPPVVDYF